MAGIRVVNTLEVSTDIGQCQIQLCIGDITALPKEDKVDVLVISAFPGDYSPTPTSLIGQLLRKLKVNVRSLAKDKEEDLRELYSCWWSRPLEDHLSFRKILCFEGSFKPGRKIGQVVGDVFRCLVPILANQEGKVIMPILASGDQMFSKVKMLKLLVNAAVHWMKAGLPLRCLKIVLFSRNIENISRADEPLVELFNDLKKIHENDTQQKEEEEKKMAAHAFDVYLSYSEEDTKCMMDVVDSLKKNKSDVRIFSTIQELDNEESWQEKLYGTIIKSQRVIALITPSFLKSTRCTEQYNIALCHSRKVHNSILVPLYVSEVPYMPTYMKLTQYIDCRIDRVEKINVACITVVSCLSITPLETTEQANVQEVSSVPEKYDVFLSYSHCNEDKSKKVMKELRSHKPDINIFIDTAELQAGGAWQQTLYHALDSSKFVIAMISNDYLRSKVCLEELSLSAALHQQGSCKVFPLIIEPLEENIEWLSLLSPVTCLLETTEQEVSSITSVCEEIVRGLKEPPSQRSKEESAITSLTSLLEEARSLLFQREYRFESLLSDCGHAAPTSVLSPTRTSPSKADVYIISSADDSNHCHLLMQLIHAQIPSLIVKTSSDEINTARLAFLDDARLIISLLSSSFMESPELVHEMNIAWCRQRSSLNFRFLAITIDSLPDKPTYAHLIPSFFNCEDKKWEESAALKQMPPSELTHIFSTSKCRLNVLLCFIAATNLLLEWLDGQNCFVFGLHDKFTNCLHLGQCVRRLKETLIVDDEEKKKDKVESVRDDETSGIKLNTDEKGDTTNSSDTSEIASVPEKEQGDNKSRDSLNDLPVLNTGDGKDDDDVEPSQRENSGRRYASSSTCTVI